MSPQSVTSKQNLSRAAGIQRRVRRGEAVDFVANTVQSRIQKGYYPAGQRLTESELTRDLKVSRSSVREALRRLAAEGLVEFQPNRGVTVPALSRSDMLRLVDVMELLSLMGIKDLAGRSSEKALQRKLQRLLKVTRAFKRKPDEKLDAAAGLEENRRFHADLVALGGNPFLSRLLPKLQIHVFRIGPHNPIATSRAAWVAGHEEILNAIIAGQPAAAEAHLRRYVLWIRSIMVELPYKEEIGGSKS